MARFGDQFIEMIDIFQGRADSVLEGQKTAVEKLGDTLRDSVAAFVDVLVDPLQLIANTSERSADALENIDEYLTGGGDGGRVPIEDRGGGKKGPTVPQAIESGLENVGEDIVRAIRSGMPDIQLNITIQHNDNLVNG